MPAVLDYRLGALETWAREHSHEDDDRHAGQEERIRSLELSRAKMVGGIAAAAAGGSALMQAIIWMVSKLV